MPILHPAPITLRHNSEQPQRLAVTRIDLAPHSASPIRIAWLSDPHIGATRAEIIRGQATAPAAQASIAQVASGEFAAALWLGDLALSEGRPADYALFSEIAAPLAQRMPVILGMGNHDLRSELLKAFTGSAPERADSKLHLLADVRTPHARIFLLDTCLSPSVVGGAVGRAPLDWMASELAGDDPRPVIVALHHSLGTDDEDLFDTDRLLDVVQGHAKVKLVLHGHIHRWRQTVARGIPVWSLPSCGFRFEIEDWVGWAAMEIARDGLTLTPRALHSGGGLETLELRW